MYDGIDVFDKRLFLSNTVSGIIKPMGHAWRCFWHLVRYSLGLTPSTFSPNSIFDIDMPVSISNMRSTTHKSLVTCGYRKTFRNDLLTESI